MVCCIRFYLFLDLVLFVLLDSIVLGFMLGGLGIGGVTLIISCCPATLLDFLFRGD
jgi:hypothetical protein